MKKNIHSGDIYIYIIYIYIPSYLAPKTSWRTSTNSPQAIQNKKSTEDAARGLGKQGSPPSRTTCLSPDFETSRNSSPETLQEVEVASSSLKKNLPRWLESL